jgi:hypothetical protein
MQKIKLMNFLFSMCKISFLFDVLIAGFLVQNYVPLLVEGNKGSLTSRMLPLQGHLRCVKNYNIFFPFIPMTPRQECYLSKGIYVV